MKVFWVSYTFRWDYVLVTLFAEDELDARQKADNYVFNRASYKVPQQELKSSFVEEAVPDENGIIDVEHSSHD